MSTTKNGPSAKWFHMSRVKIWHPYMSTDQLVQKLMLTVKKSCLVSLVIACLISHPFVKTTWTLIYWPSNLGRIIRKRSSYVVDFPPLIQWEFTYTNYPLHQSVSQCRLVMTDTITCLWRVYKLRTLLSASGERYLPLSLSKSSWSGNSYRSFICKTKTQNQGLNSWKCVLNIVTNSHYHIMNSKFHKQDFPT